MNDQRASDSSERLQVAVAFLKHILPEEGFRCAYVLHENRKWNSFFATNEQLAQFILESDERAFTAYHACSTFTVGYSDPRGTPRAERRLGRTGHNVLGTRSLWADVDCGEGKPYPTQADGAEHVAAFIRAANFPAPIYVGSGNGLHLYWPLDQTIDPATWRRYAAGLAALFNHHGLHVDPMRTQDLSSVLRTPGTHHRKNGVKEVVSGPLQGPYSIELFERLLKNGPLSKPHQMASRSMAVEPEPQSKAGREFVGADLIGGLFTDRPSSAEEIARSCRQINALQERPGDVSEPHWHAALGVLAHCTDGVASAHSWAAPDWHGAIDEKLERLEGFGPTTCAKFAAVNPGACVGCRWSGRITSPIQLGRDDHQDRGDGTQIQGSKPETDRVNGFHSVGQLLAQDGIPIPPKDFGYDADQRLHHVSGGRNGGNVYDLVCEYPIYLKAVQVAENEDSRYGLVFREKKARQAWRDVVVSSRQAFGRESTTELAERGVVIHDGELWRKYVRNAVDQWHKEKDVEQRYDQFGWKDEETAFLVGKRLYTPTAILPATGSPTLENRAQYLTISTQKGASLERWQAAANKLFAAGLEHQSLALLAGFAAPLMRFHATGEGGAILSFVSDNTASGKTTALEAAASVWGQHKGLKLDETDTRVAKGLKLGVLGNLPCTFDELHERDPELIRQFVLIFTNGTDKDRGTSDGGLKINKAEWQTILLTASNTSIVDILSTMKSSDAPAARVMEFNTELPPHVTKESWDHIKRELNYNHGFAGHEFMKRLIQPEYINWIRDNIADWCRLIAKEAGLDEKHRFWVRLMVSIWAAGKIIQGKQKGDALLEFDLDRIMRWVIAYAAENSTIIRGASASDAPAQLSMAMSAFLLDTLVVAKEFKPGPQSRCAILRAPVRQLLVRYEVEGKRLYMSEIALRRWLVAEGINTQNFFLKMRRAEIILGEVKKMTLGAGTDLASGQLPCITVNMASPALSGLLTTLEEALPSHEPRSERIKHAERERPTRSSSQ